MKCRLLYLLLIFKVSVVVALAQNITDTVSENNTIVNVSTSSFSTSTQTTTASSAVPYSTHSNTHYVTQQPKSTTTRKVSFPVPPPRTLFPEDGTKAECKKSVPTCEKLQKNSCLGSTLPYSHTSLALINDSSTQADVQNMLDLWAGLRHAPKCWDVIQPLLCAVYMPECNMSTSGNFVYLPGKELCVVTREPCRIVKSTRGWPAFLQCDNKHFVPGCSVSQQSSKCFRMVMFGLNHVNMDTCMCYCLFNIKYKYIYVFQQLNQDVRRYIFVQLHCVSLCVQQHSV